MTRLMPPLRNVLAMLAAADWRCAAQLLKHGQGMLTAVLQSMLSPLEMGACIAVVDGSDAKHGIRILLAVISLFFALCDWHVPLFISYHNFICRFLSAICMQALFPYSPTSACLAFLYPTFGKRTQSTPTSAPESGVAASEHVSTSAGDKISLDDVIEKLTAAGNEDTRGQEILAAAATLRDSSGRDRQTALRKMASAWGVTLNEKVGGKYKPRPTSALAEDIQASVCKAALDWESRAEPSRSSDTRSPSRVDAEAGAVEHGDGIEVDEHPATMSTELFAHDREEDRILLDWLRERPEHARCSALLQQIMEWTEKCQKSEMRSLAKAQGITLRRQDHADVQKLRDAVRRHFKAAVAQEKGRLACFHLSAARGASEHSDAQAREAEHVLNAAEVVDMRTLLLFRRQKKADMPDHLQEAIRLLGGEVTDPTHEILEM